MLHVSYDLVPVIYSAWFYSLSIFYSPFNFGDDDTVVLNSKNVYPLKLVFVVLLLDFEETGFLYVCCF